MIARMLLVLVSLAPAVAAAAPTQAELVEMLEVIDRRQSNPGADYKSLAYIEQKEKNKNDLVYEAVIYRRDDDDKLMILFTKPKAEAGKGYLRIDKNLWMFDPTVGKWERRTERERIGGTDSRRQDFDESRLAQEYTPEYLGEEKLGKFAVHHLKLVSKPGTDVAYPVMELWVDAASGNVLKAQEFALSGRLMRTVYYPRYESIPLQGRSEPFYFPKEIRIYDEVEKANSTVVLMQSVDLSSLPGNLFTKAWLESKSR